MEPQDPYQYRKPDESLPPVQSSPQSDWTPAGPNSPFITPSVDPRVKRRKILLITVGILMSLLVLIAIVATYTGNSGRNSVEQEYIEGPTTDVALSDQDAPLFSIRYSSELEVLINEELTDEDGWFLGLAESEENSSYNINVRVSTNEPEFIDGEEAVFELTPTEGDPYNVDTSDVVTAGVRTKKTTGEYTQNDANYIVAYSVAKVGERYVEVTALYPKDNQTITKSFDAMLGSIRLK